MWAPRLDGVGMALMQMALSNTSGIGLLKTTRDFAHNQGTACLVHDRADGESHYVEVNLAQLDDYIEPTFQIGLMKVDVEGHELEVLHGTTNALRNHQIRDIV